MNRDKIEKLEASKSRALAMGGDASVAKHRARGRLTVRERLNALFDAGSFLEFGLHADHAGV